MLFRIIVRKKYQNRYILAKTHAFCPRRGRQSLIGPLHRVYQDAMFKSRNRRNIVVTSGEIIAAKNYIKIILTPTVLHNLDYLESWVHVVRCALPED